MMNLNFKNWIGFKGWRQTRTMRFISVSAMAVIVFSSIGNLIDCSYLTALECNLIGIGVMLFFGPFFGTLQLLDWLGEKRQWEFDYRIRVYVVASGLLGFVLYPSYYIIYSAMTGGETTGTVTNLNGDTVDALFGMPDYVFAWVFIRGLIAGLVSTLPAIASFSSRLVSWQNESAARTALAHLCTYITGFGLFVLVDTGLQSIIHPEWFYPEAVQRGFFLGVVLFVAPMACPQNLLFTFLPFGCKGLLEVPYNLAATEQLPLFRGRPATSQLSTPCSATNRSTPLST